MLLLAFLFCSSVSQTPLVSIGNGFSCFFFFFFFFLLFSRLSRLLAYCPCGVLAGNFFSSALYQAPLPSCIVAACDDELNVNMVLPPLCCSALPWGPFVSVANQTVDFLVPQFLAAALALPSCRDQLLQLTQQTFSYLQTTQQQLSVHVYHGSG